MTPTINPLRDALEKIIEKVRCKFSVQVLYDVSDIASKALAAEPPATQATVPIERIDLSGLSRHDFDWNGRTDTPYGYFVAFDDVVKLLTDNGISVVSTAPPSPAAPAAESNKPSDWIASKRRRSNRGGRYWHVKEKDDLTDDCIVNSFFTEGEAKQYCDDHPDHEYFHWVD